jgi:hypothetical protein
MDEQTHRPTPRYVIDALDTGVSDIAAHHVHDAFVAFAGTMGESDACLRFTLPSRGSIS